MKRSPRSSGMLVATIAAVALSGGPAVAFSHLVCGRVLDLRVSGPLSPRQVFRTVPWNSPAAVACPASNATFPIPLPPGATIDDPTVSGGSITFKDSLSGSPVTYLLPAPNWSGLGNPPGVLGYQYNNTVITPANPCMTVRVRPQELKAVCKSPSGLVVPLTGT